MENTNINENINSEIIIHMNIQNQVRKNTSAQEQSDGLQEAKRKDHKNEIEVSLLDITYPYYHQSMLSKSKFHGFECLMFQAGIYFCILYTVSNYVNTGHVLKWDILSIIINNLRWDAYVISIGLLLAFLQMYLSHLLIVITKPSKNKNTIMYAYCISWLFLFVVAGIYVMNLIQFYFTDRIFLIVVSWSFPVKTASYCIDQLQIATGNTESQNLKAIISKLQAQSLWKIAVLKFKFIISPTIIYKQFILDHNPRLKIHVSYLLIKSAVASVCLLINYILVTQLIAPYLLPKVYNPMSFIELFFKLIPLAFYVNMCLYYMIMENIMLSMAEITQLKHRHFYLDWWNATTVSQFLDKWVLQINAFSDAYLNTITKRWKHLTHLVIIFIMLFSVFGEELNFKIAIFAVFNIGVVFFVGQNRLIQNNYIVHFLTISFTPFCLAAQLKYKIFS